MILEDVLLSAAVDYRTSTGNKYEVTMCCPFCSDHGFSQDDSFHLGLNILKGLGHCFRCGWKYRGVLSIARELCKVYGIKVPTGRIRQEKEEVKSEEPLPVGLPAGYERFTSKPDSIEVKARNYLKQRKVSQLQISRHKVGYAAIGNLAWRIIFPVLDADNEIHGWVARSFSDAKPKYLNSPGMKGLWNAKFAKTAVVVEGIMDALRVETALLRVRDSVAVARLGSVITPLQLTLLKQYENVIIFPDADKAGVFGAIELAGRCDAIGLTTGITVPEKLTGRDPGNMSSDEILETLRGAKRYTQEVVYRLRAVASKDIEVAFQ